VKLNTWKKRLSLDFSLQASVTAMTRASHLKHYKTVNNELQNHFQNRKQRMSLLSFLQKTFADLSACIIRKRIKKAAR